MKALATLDKARPEEALAKLHSSDAHFLFGLRSRIEVRSDTGVNEFSALERIQQALDHNRRCLDALPSEEALRPLVETVRKALAFTSERNIKRHVGMLIGSFPNANATNPETYAAALIYDLLDCRIPDAILILTCQEIRRSARFLPTISEVLQTAKRHLGEWLWVLEVPETILRNRQELAEAVAIVERILRHVQANRKPPQAQLNRVA